MIGEASKHYYMGSQRVATALITYPYQDEGEDPLDQSHGVTKDFLEVLDHYGLTAGDNYDEEEVLSAPTINLFESETDYQNQADGCEDEFCKCSQSEYWAGQADGIDCSELRIMYWYHPDYLGNTEFITDFNGDAYQYFWYSPWGESLVDQYSTSGTYNSPYRFNGKELDPETGNYYYGARYYNPQISIWLSVDPFASKYPALTPYTFVADNPVMLIDPNGREIDITGQDGKVTVYKPGMTYKGKDAFTRKTVEAYNKAYAGSNKAKEIINNVVKSNNKYKVVKTNGSSNFSPNHVVNDKTGKDAFEGGTIEFNPDEEIPVQTSNNSLTSKMEKNPMMVLLHETIHSSRAEDGIWDGVTIYGKTGIRTEELETSHVENIIRTQMGLPLRTNYSVDVLPNGSRRGGGFPLLKYKGGIISNYLWQSSKKIYKYR